jgi:large subunit ribosomal protein L1
MAKLTKKAKALAEKFDAEKLYKVDEAIAALKDNSTAKFDETIEIALNLGVDPRHADQMVAASCRCPRAPARTCASPSSPAPARPRKPLRRAPKWSGPRI